MSDNTLPAFDTEVTFESTVTWVPGLSAVHLTVACRYCKQQNTADLNEISNELTNVAQEAKLTVLREICDDSIKVNMMKHPVERIPARVGMYHMRTGTHFAISVVAVDTSETEAATVDTLEKTLWNFMWSHITTAPAPTTNSLPIEDSQHI